MIERAIALDRLLCLGARLGWLQDQLDTANLRLQAHQKACCYRLEGNNVPIATTPVRVNVN